MTKWAPMSLSPVSLKSLLPSLPPWRRDLSSLSVWSLHTFYIEPSGPWLTEYVCMQMRCKMEPIKKKCWIWKGIGRQLSLPKVFLIRLVCFLSHHDGSRDNQLSEGCSKTVCTQKFPLFFFCLFFVFCFGCYGDSPITFVLRAAAMISAWNCPTDVNIRLQWMTVGRVLQSLIILVGWVYTLFLVPPGLGLFPLVSAEPGCSCLVPGWNFADSWSLPLNMAGCCQMHPTTASSWPSGCHKVLNLGPLVLLQYYLHHYFLKWLDHRTFQMAALHTGKGKSWF